MTTTAGGINLIPEVPREEIVKVEKKEKINLSGVFFIFVVVFFTLVILGVNLLVRLEYNKNVKKLEGIKAEITQYNYVEIKQKTFNNKMGTYEVVNQQDFNADKVLEYLLEVAKSLSTVNTLYLDSEMNFELRGESTSYTNVARLWHDMSREQDYFETINLQYVRRSEDQDSGKESVNFAFTGKMMKDNVSKL